MAISCKSNNLESAPDCSTPSGSRRPSMDEQKLSSPASGRWDLLIRDLKSFARDISLIPNMAILSLVGKQMKNMVGISGKMFSTLAREKVNIEMISQGASEINISCVILQSDAIHALRCVHEMCV